MFRFIQFLTHKQDELIKKVDHIQYGLNEVKTNVDRVTTALWSLQDDLHKITGVMEEYDEDYEL